MKKIALLSITTALLFACKTEKKTQEQPTATKTDTIVTVFADAQTTPVTSDDDAADDSCIWINPKDVLKSTIIGTNKREGLEVYDLDGNILNRYKIGKVNNVDIRDGFMLNGKEVSVVTASNRTDNSIAILIVKENGELENVAARTIISKLQPVYGLGMYKSAKTNKFYVFMVDKLGEVEQWELFENNAKIDAKLVRQFNIGSQGEGIVADDFYGKVYIGEEEKALWKYDAEPTAKNERVLITKTSDINMKADFEGVTIYDKGNGKGYVILSSQGNNSYAVFDRVSNKYLGSFAIKDGNIDGTYDTDGIDVTSVAFGKKYPKGFFIAQDGANTQEKDSLNQNFKIVDWKSIEKKLNLK